MVAIECTKRDRARAVASIERWFRDSRAEPLGDVAPGGLPGSVDFEVREEQSGNRPERDRKTKGAT